MAIKQKNNAKQKGKLMNVLTTEYRFESLILAFLTILTACLGVLLLNGTLKITNFPVLSDRPNDMIFAWSIIVVSILGLALVIYPFFLPAIPELKKVTWPTLRKMLDYTLRVLIFTAILTLVILAYDIIIVRIIEVIAS